VKNHDFTQKNHIFSNFRGAPPQDPPLRRVSKITFSTLKVEMLKSQIIFFLSFGSNTLLDTIVSKIICFKNDTLFRKSYDLATIVYFAKDTYSIQHYGER